MNHRLFFFVPYVRLTVPRRTHAIPLRERPRRRFVTLSASNATDPGMSSVLSANRFRSNFSESNEGTLLDLVPKGEWDDYVQRQLPVQKAWLTAHGSPTSPTPVPAADASIDRFVLPIKPGSQNLWRLAAAFSGLPKGKLYTINEAAGFDNAMIELAWGLTAYTFTQYKKRDEEPKELTTLVRRTASGSAERADVDRALHATYMVRDMISTPAEDFGPPNLEAAVSTLAAQHAARSSSIVGQQLLQHDFPQVHRVGRAASSDRAPRLLELIWNQSAERSLTLVGKGVCYDTGGLSLKPTSSMLTMSKDMGGAAHVLGLAHMIMDAKLDVRLRVLIPAVENAVGSNSYRPGDILTARNGMTTLNSNSDAEGRLILADALVAATEDNPELIIDCATLTGAQRVALGPEIPGVFCDDDEISDELYSLGKKVEDLVWRLPLHEPYRKLLDTPLADIKSCGSTGLGAAITAALYLKEFVGDAKWMHIDLMAYNSTSSPGRPEGGEAMGLRALFELVRKRFS
ncbi:Cytosol aminopeptidase [Gracilaria domingensis]|nr:Cytosol aminopeptidase [Gracilaria domingensis]